MESDPILNQSFDLTINKEYLVFGLHFRDKGHIVLQCVSDSGNLIFAPINIFEIIDDSVSSAWKIKYWEDGEITLWPEDFYEGYFHEDLSEGILEIVDKFKKIQQHISNEAKLLGKWRE
jgi:hypothetical protein